MCVTVTATRLMEFRLVLRHHGLLRKSFHQRVDDDFSGFMREKLHLSELARLQSGVARLQDDWVISSESREDAEKILSEVMKCYRKFGLEINGGKTKITHILSSEETSWKSEITAFKSHRSGRMKGARLEEFLALCLRHQIDYPGQPVVSYTLPIIESQRFFERDVEAVETFLLKAAAISPISLDVICRVMLNIEYRSGALSRTRIRNRFLKLCISHAERQEYYEVIWLLYTLRGLKCSFVSSALIDALADAPKVFPI